MKPDRSNYEVWFIDWLDGKLNENQAEELKRFLGENPDLKEEMEMLPFLELKPEESGFRYKATLMKTPESYTESQFEYLCIAHLENDLTPGQSSELMDIISRDPERKKRFDLIQRTKLTPDNVSFPGKSSVKRLTIPGRIQRISLIGLSAAASVAILVIAYLFLRPQTHLNSDLAILNSVRDTLLIMKPPAFQVARTMSSEKTRVVQAIPVVRASKNSLSGVTESEQQTSSLKINDSRTSREMFSVGSINVLSTRNLKLGTWAHPNYIAGFNPGIMPPTYDPYGRRSNVDRFLARFFHERIMKDKSAGDRPVGSYELAEAGMKGINKLLGREIAFQSR